MKLRNFLSLALSIVLASTISAQEKFPANYKIQSAGLAVGMISDSYQKMDLEAMRDFTQNPQLMDRNLDGYVEELYRISEGSAVEASISLAPYDYANQQYSTNREIRIGLMYSEREPMIEYIKNGNRNTEDIIYCALVDEVALRVAYLWKGQSNLLPNFNYYAGVSFNAGAAINNQLLIMENVMNEEGFVEYREEYLEAKTSVYTRYSVPIGVNYTFFDKVSLGLETSLGMGVQSVVGGKNYWIPFSMSFSPRLSYIL